MISICVYDRAWRMRDLGKSSIEELALAWGLLWYLSADTSILAPMRESFAPFNFYYIETLHFMHFVALTKTSIFI